VSLYRANPRPQIISLLDAALEIPQRGILRSLNVHVSGALALYEYVRQAFGPQ
jgi:tRNA G18 (ribose-2'-O)-methylase SpoU